MDERELLDRLVAAEAELIRVRAELADEQVVSRLLRYQLRVARSNLRPVPFRTPVRPLPAAMRTALEKEKKRWTRSSTASSATSASPIPSPPIPAQRPPSEPTRPHSGNNPHSHGSDQTPYGGTIR